MTDRNMLVELLFKRVTGKGLDELEIKTLEAWCTESQDNLRVAELFKDKSQLEEHFKELNEIPSNEIWAEILKTLEQPFDG